MANRAKQLFAVINRATANLIIDSVAANYGISRLEAMREMIAPDAEDILDYVTGPQRAATSVLLQKYQIKKG